MCIRDSYGGDLNQDDVTDISDIIILINMIIEVELDSSGDLNADGNIDILDIIELVNIILYS